MIFSGGGSTAIKKTRYLFIDGAYLDKVFEEVNKLFFEAPELLIDYSLISSYDKIFYYHALPGREYGEKKDAYEQRIKEKEDFYNQLKLVPNFHVYEGVTYGKGGRLRQKAVDIKIAVDMLKHTINGNMDTATLIAGDLDFKPLLDALLMEGMFTTIFYHSSSYSKELLYSADNSQKMTISQIYQWTTKEFKEKYSVPQMTTQVGGTRNIENLTKIKELIINGKIPAVLFQDTTKSFLVEFNKDAVREHSTYITYHDLKKLYYFMKEDRELDVSEK